MKTKQRVTGIGGIFFKVRDPKKIQAWYKKHLGLPLDPAWGGWSFDWRDAKSPKKKGSTAWSVFETNTDYFKPSKKPFMINYRVADLRRVLTELKKEGVWIDPKSGEGSEFGKFGWIMDCEGNRIELWEPPKPPKPKKKK
jgi:predicted enzyme related to lactoylglutathione lyase